MLLNDFFASAPWAITPDAMESLSQFLFNATTPGAEQEQAAMPSSASGNDRPARAYAVQDGVAIIDVQGVIHRTSGSLSFFGMHFSWEGQDTIRAAITEAMQDVEVSAILLSFNSPGGVVAGIKELNGFIAAQTDKPIYSYADSLCASAAYWLASATGRVYAPATAQVGSIGVISVHCDRSAVNAARGLRYTYLTGGKWKATGNPDNPLSREDQAHLQTTITQLHEIFRSDVAAHMGVDAADPTAWGDGQVFLADTALELGLISGIVTDRDALVARINKETRMDKEQLAKAHPELLAQIQAEARAEGKAEAEQTHLDALAKATSTMQIAVGMIAGDEVASYVKTVIAAGVTAEQLQLMAPMLKGAGFTKADAAAATQAAAGQPDAQTPEAKETASDSRADVLAALRGATPAPVNTSVTPQGGDAVQAAIDQISSVGL